MEPIAMVVKKIGMVEAGGHCEKRHESLEHQKRVRGSVKIAQGTKKITEKILK